MPKKKDALKGPRRQIKKKNNFECDCCNRGCFDFASDH